MEFNIKFPKELQTQLSKIANIDEVAPKMIEAAQPIYVAAIRRRAPKKTGDLEKSVTATKPRKTKTGGWIGTITFKGTSTRKNKDGTTVKVPNVVKAAVLEYGKRGNEKYKHQFIYPATKDCEQEANEKMQEVFSEAMK